jgi:hypothetical protein
MSSRRERPSLRRIRLVTAHISGSIHRRCASMTIWRGIHIVRQLAAVLLSCALFSVVLLTSSPSEAYADASGQAVVDDARSYIGTPYGAGGMDCSGFTSAVFADLGVYLPDGPDAQYAYGTPSYGEAGDLMFFDEAGYGISQRVASILTCPQVDATSSNQPSPSPRSHTCIMRCGSPSVKPAVTSRRRWRADKRRRSRSVLSDSFRIAQLPFWRACAAAGNRGRRLWSRCRSCRSPRRAVRRRGRR